MESLLSSPILQQELLGNTVKDFVVAVFVFLVLLVVFGMFRGIVLRRLTKLAEKTQTDIDDIFIQIVEELRPPFYSFVAFYLAVSLITLTPLAQRVINAILIIWIVYQAIGALRVLVHYSIDKQITREPGSQSILNLIRGIAIGLVWVLGALLVLQNLGVNVTSLMAGLGIGGLAVALALQNILSDLFSSFAIHFDKPFQQGDFIIVGNHLGVVEKVGIKTTRIRALQGEEIVISNQELTSTRIQNFKKMRERRVTFAFGVEYRTPIKTLKQIPQLVMEIIQSVELTRFDRAHFNKFDDSSLTFEVVYYVQSPEYSTHMDISQEIHFKIKEEFEKREISMAFPTRTIYMEKVASTESHR